MMANSTLCLNDVLSPEEAGSNKFSRRKKEANPELLRKLYNGIKYLYTFDNVECLKIEEYIDTVIINGDKGQLKPHTIDRGLRRNKYFFGERYTYGCGLGSEKLYPEGFVEPIPRWMEHLIIKPLEKARVLEQDFVNSAVINIYLPGGCIVSHIDPPQIFDRPIVTVSFFCDTLLCFGCKFSFKPIRTSTPIASVPLVRGSATSISGYAADNITHCIRPQDITSRRAAIILRRVLPSAPRLDHIELYCYTDTDFFSRLASGRKRRYTKEETEILYEIKHFSKRARYDGKIRHHVI